MMSSNDSVLSIQSHLFVWRLIFKAHFPDSFEQCLPANGVICVFFQGKQQFVHRWELPICMNSATDHSFLKVVSVLLN